MAVAAGNFDLTFDMIRKRREENMTDSSESSHACGFPPVRFMSASVIGDESPAFDDDQTIHSGHFMVSHVHDEVASDELITDQTRVKDDISDDESDSELTIVPQSVPAQAIGAMSTASTASASSLQDTALTIDDSLTKLFECMTLAYRLVVAGVSIK